MKQKQYVFASGMLAVAAAAVLWSLDGTFARPQLYSLSPVLVVFLEHLFGVLALSPIFLIYFSQIKRITKKAWFALFLVALFGGALGTTFFTKALFVSGFQNISVLILLQKFQPIFAIILARILLKETFAKQFYVYTAIALIAGYFVTFKDFTAIQSVANVPLLAVLFALLAAFSWGSATTLGKYSVNSIPFLLVTALRFLLTAFIMLVPVLYLGVDFATVSQHQWLLFLYIVFGSGATAMLLYYWGLKKIPASLATLAELAWPVSAILFDYLLNGTVFSLTQMVGVIVLLTAVIKITQLTEGRSSHGK